MNAGDARRRCLARSRQRRSISSLLVLAPMGDGMKAPIKFDVENPLYAKIISHGVGRTKALEP